MQGILTAELVVVIAVAALNALVPGPVQTIAQWAAGPVKISPYIGAPRLPPRPISPVAVALAYLCLVLGTATIVVGLGAAFRLSRPHRRTSRSQDNQ